jgi:hypothetical protein
VEVLSAEALSCYVSEPSKLEQEVSNFFLAHQLQDHLPDGQGHQNAFLGPMSTRFLCQYHRAILFLVTFLKRTCELRLPV